MEDKVYMPPKPVNQFSPPECCPPPPPPHGWDYPSCGKPPYAPPPVPPPPSPECVPVCPPPGLKQIPPIPSVCEGSSLYEAMNIQIQRTNACIEQWNNISRNCFAAMNACVEAARANDVYYDDCEVHYQEGFDENEGCAYAIVEKQSVDRNGRPIFVKLVPAYKNTTNSGVVQDIFDVSFIESANLIITAVPTAQKNWYGPAMYNGAPIPGIDQNIMHPIEGQNPTPPLVHPGWVYGFNRQGWLRFFPKTVTETDLCQNGMVNCLGSCWPIISNGELTNEAKELTTKASITAIGFNKGTGSVFFFSCSAQDQPGMTGVSVGKLLQGFGCTTAVITTMIDGTNKTMAAGMMYMGQMTTVPQAGKTPENLAYWVISKRANFKNRFQKEIADLVQVTGQNAWKNYLLGVQIQDFDDRIDENANAIKAETERAMQAEQWLQENINKEVERAMQAEAWLQENINKEVERATAEEQRLDQKIDDEIDRATQSEQELNQKIIDETNRATQAENKLAADIAAEKLRAMNRENEIQAALDKEIRERIAADNDIINALEQEVLARRAADTALENKIDAVKNDLTIDINNLENILNGITGGQTNLPYLKLTGGTMTGTVTFTENNTITLGRGPTEDMEAATKKYVDDAVAAGGGGGGGGDVTKEYVDQQVSTLQNQITGKVSKSGDTMSGALDMDGNKIENAVLSSNTGTTLDNGAGGPGKITNLDDPTEPTDAVNLKTVQQKIDDTKQELSGEFLPLAGGIMTGDINMTDASHITFYDPQEMAAMLVKNAVTASSTPVMIRPSATAKRLGITKEILADAQSRGLELKYATIEDVYKTMQKPRTTNNEIEKETEGEIEKDNNVDNSPVLDILDIPGQIARGFVYNDSQDMCMQSTGGNIGLKGAKISITDGEGNSIPIEGASKIGPAGEDDAIIFHPTSTAIKGPLNVTDVIGQPTGQVNAGKAVIGGVTLEPHVTSGSSDTHLDIDVPTSKGAVYINRTQNGSAVSGGTGEIHVTEIHSPQQLIIRPATSMSLNGKQIKNVANGTIDNDAVNLRQLKDATEIPSFGGNMIQFPTIQMSSFEFNNLETKQITLAKTPDNYNIDLTMDYNTSNSTKIKVYYWSANGYLYIIAKCAGSGYTSNLKLLIRGGNCYFISAGFQKTITLEMNILTTNWTTAVFGGIGVYKAGSNNTTTIPLMLINNTSLVNPTPPSV